MIIAFHPTQIDEVSRAFDAPWFMSDSLYPTYIHKENTGKAEDKEKASNDDVKPPAKESPDNSKKACTPNANSCRNNNKSKSTFNPCRDFHRAARCARRAFNQQELSKVIERRTPIHYDEETPQVAKMSLDVTGFAPEDIAINVEDFVVSIKGERTNRLGDVFVLDRRFRLDKTTVIVDGVTASIDDGILQLTVPKKSTVGPRTIPISISTSVTNQSLSQKNEEASSSHEEEVVVTDSINGAEHSESADGTSHEEQLDNIEENKKHSIEVETVHEEDKIDGQQVEKATQSIGIPQDEKEIQITGSNTDDATMKSAEQDEAWEEVSK